VYSSFGKEDAMIQLSSSDPSIQSQIIDLHRRNLRQQGIVSPSTQDLVLRSLLGSHNYDQRLMMLQQELQYQSYVNQLQIQRTILMPNAALSNHLMIPPHYQASLQLEQQRIPNRAWERVLPEPNRQSQASIVLPQLPVQEILANSVNRPPMNRELLNILLGAHSRSAAVITDPRPMAASSLLAHPDDAVILSAYQVVLRQNIEVFEATSEEVITHVRGRNTPVYIHQVGIRCIHCKHVPLARRQKGAVYFPSSTLRIYQAAQNMATTHMISGVCTDIPNQVTEQFQALMVTKSSGGGGGREYWAKCARDLGLVDTPIGIRFRCNLPAGLETLSYIREL
jgi:hypothetical protein